MELVASTLVSSLLMGLFYGLVGIGLTIVFGVMRLLNIAHGEFIMLGAFTVYLMDKYFGVGVFVATTFVVIPLGFLFGLIVYYTIVPRLSRSEDPETMSLLGFFGLSIVLTSLAAELWGTSLRGLESPLPLSRVTVAGLTLPFGWVTASAVSGIAIAATFVYLKYARAGKATRALMQNLQLAQSYGINVRTVAAVSFAISTVLAAVAGAMTPLIAPSISPSMGLQYTIAAFTVIIIGSSGRPLGALVGGVIYSEALGLSSLFLSPATSSMTAYALLIFIIYFRPQGLLERT